MIEIRVPYVEYPSEAFNTEGPSLTKQSFAEECDFNFVMARYEKTGIIPHLEARLPQYTDVSSMVDYQEAHNLVISARASFDALPAAVRERFNNDPSSLIAFLGGENNRSEAEKLGLVTPKVIPAAPLQAAGGGDNLQPPKEA